ncbi:Predicted dehydrogenase [Saccharopolyspora antimicrobica]|uniref:Dehydrogenase n=1 Tax=Saccharopolyspora antimicrobica TaxID=455193 RepID=A0A1I5LP78_9PSEU|nr:Gfo/Idh/MocA family oxidoreductase [Saccharopolyspora antimicrobica]RKT87841.1 putative dehydrogenase [Saccharopolyspora antimicrobica]SFO98571.1 Predicted dehydrogenase [Saccharopolyspora antimicrobica]
MNIVIVGIGMIGARHVACFGRAGHRITTVDRKEGADHDRVADVPARSDVDAWVVATPTATHLAVVSEILRCQPNARILLEKPACYPAELGDLVDLVRRHPRARIVVNDVYAHSRVVRRFAESVHRAAAGDPIRKITIEFTKNRVLDIANGRFVDTQYGEAGYECFHMLSILRAILPAGHYERYLRTNPALVTPEMRVRTAVPELPEVELYTSSGGAIGFAGLAGFAFSASTAKRYLARSIIPFSAELRYRFADVELVSGKHVTLVFEPSYGVAADYKNEHTVHVRDAGSQQRVTVSGNHFEEALLAQLDFLCGADEGTAVLRLAEHRLMAALGLTAATGSFAWPVEPELQVGLPGNGEELARFGSA